MVDLTCVDKDEKISKNSLKMQCCKSWYAEHLFVLSKKVKLYIDTSVEDIALAARLFRQESMNLLRLLQDALLDMVRRSRIHFVHCILPKADALKALSGSLYKGGECEAQGESGDSSLMQLDVALLRAQLRGSKLLDSLRIYRQGEVAASVTHEGQAQKYTPVCPCVLRHGVL